MVITMSKRANTKILFICILLIIVSILAFFVLPLNIVPNNNKGYLVLLCKVGDKEIALSESQTAEVVHVLSNYKVQGTLYNAYYTVHIPTYYFVITFQDERGVTYATRGVNIGADGGQNNFVGGYTPFLSLYRKVIHGDDLYQKIDELLKSWGY